jgi:hypothetical protein
MGILLIVILFIAVVVIMISKRMRALTPAELQRDLEERLASLRTYEYGSLNPALRCPYCRKKGKIRIKRVERKQEGSGVKATEAILTGGKSILASDVSRRNR